VIYLGAFLILGRLLQGSLPPPPDLGGLWFYAGIAALVLGTFLDEPFYATPADALLNGVAVLVADIALTQSGGVIDAQSLEIGRGFFGAYAGVVIVIASVAISLKDEVGLSGRLAAACAGVARVIGAGSVMYSLAFFGTVYAAFADSAGKLAVLYLTWVASFHLSPVERLLTFLDRARAANAKFGIVEQIIDPGLLVVRLRRGVTVVLGARVKVGVPPKSGTVVTVTTLLGEQRARVSVSGAASVAVGTEVALESASAVSGIVGFAMAGTTLNELRVELVPDAGRAGLEIGRLLETPVGDRETLFQVVSAEIEEEAGRAYVRTPSELVATKLGRWAQEQSAFVAESWMPDSGSIVTLVPAVEAAFESNYLGHVPLTAYGVGLRVHEAVTHNTAILGILGVGKTHLAWELIHRMLADGIKVLVLDITDRYAPHFHDVCPPTVQEDHENAIRTAIAARVNDLTVRGNEAGNVPDFDVALRDLLSRFLNGPARLMILNPSRFEVTRMEMRPSFNAPTRALMLARLSMVEITRKVGETVLQLVQAMPPPEDERARVCLVLEEAHSLVPEWNSTTQDADREAVNGTVRALLQGRKYGYGCLLITQRTANVTKSLLNQCNTILGMRVYDATGMGFLENYVGEAYSKVLGALKNREAVFYGRGSTCEAPIVIRLNDSGAFRLGFWDAAVAGISPTPAFADLAGPPPVADIPEDPHEVPF